MASHDSAGSRSHADSGKQPKTSGPSGARSHDLRIKRPSCNQALSGVVSPDVRDAAGQARTTGEPQNTKRLEIGARVRITAGLAAGKVGVVVQRWPSHFGGVPMWVVASDDLVRRRVVRGDYLEVQP